MMKRVLLLIFVEVLLAACSPYNVPQVPYYDWEKNQEKSALPAPPPAQKIRTACDDRRDKFGPDAATLKVEPQIVPIERHYQRVVRHNCDGKLLSDEIETVKDPHKQIQLTLPQTKRHVSVFVFNHTTCDVYQATMPLYDLPILGSMRPITGDGKKELVLKGDVADATFTFELRPGLNELTVEYHHDCKPTAPNENRHRRDCEESKDKTLVSYPVQVEYIEKTLPGTLERKHNEKYQDCSK